MEKTGVDISFVIINWNTCSLLIDCLHSIQKTVADCDFEVFVVDNGSEDESVAEVRKNFGQSVHLIENKTNMGFAFANNQALQRAKGTFIVLLNSDARLKQETISGLISFLEGNSDVGMVGPRMVSDDGDVQNSYDNFPSLLTETLNKSLLRALFPRRFSGKTTKASHPFEVDSLIGACVAVRARAIKEVGNLDEDYFFFLEETDWCLRMKKAGWKIYHHPLIDVVHLQGQSKRRRPVQAWIEYYRSLYLFFRKHRSVPSYMALRFFRFLKLNVNLILTVLGLCLTLGMKKRLREKSVVYAGLLWWHVRCCPDSMGLKKRS